MLFRSQYTPSKAKFEGSTETGDRYQPYQVESPQRPEPVQYTPSKAKFEGSTETGDRYQPYQVESPQRPEPIQYTPSRAKFEGKTETQERYQPFQVVPMLESSSDEMFERGIERRDVASPEIPGDEPMSIEKKADAEFLERAEPFEYIPLHATE